MPSLSKSALDAAVRATPETVHVQKNGGTRTAAVQLPQDTVTVEQPLVRRLPISTHVAPRRGAGGSSRQSAAGMFGPELVIVCRLLE